MITRLYSMLPEAAAEWEQRKIKALAQIPKAEISDDDREAITDFIDQNKEYIRQYLGMFYNQRRPMQIINGVARIHINDYLAGGLTFIERCLGASDYSDIAADVRVAIADESVKAALIESDSGGGSAAGCVEVGRLVAELAAIKQTDLFTSSYCCSAAYAIGVGATLRYASPSAMVGSIGTIMTFYDYAVMLAACGVVPHIVASHGADLKASGNSVRTPTADEMQHIQETADEYASQFIDHVWQSNGKIDAEQGFRGQAVSGRQAVEMGFIDGIRTRDEVIAELEAWAAAS